MYTWTKCKSGCKPQYFALLFLVCFYFLRLLTRLHKFCSQGSFWTICKTFYTHFCDKNGWWWHLGPQDFCHGEQWWQQWWNILRFYTPEGGQGRGIRHWSWYFCKKMKIFLQYFAKKNYTPQSCFPGTPVQRLLFQQVPPRTGHAVVHIIQQYYHQYNL